MYDYEEAEADSSDFVDNDLEIISTSNTSTVPTSSILTSNPTSSSANFLPPRPLAPIFNRDHNLSNGNAIAASSSVPVPVEKGRSRNKRSIVWKFFTASKNEVGINVCKCGHKASNKNTSNCLDHLKRDHKADLLKFGLLAEVETAEGETENNVNIESTTSILVKPAQTVTIRKFLKRQKKTYAKTNPKKRRIDEELAKFTVKGFHPLNIVEQPEFHSLTQSLNEKYILPSRSTLTNVLIPDLRKKVQDKIETLMAHSEKYATITFDGWTSMAHESYLGVTGHFISEGKLQSIALKLISTKESHTADNLSKEIQENVFSKHPEIKFICAVTDGAANMKATVNKLKLEHLECYAHKLQLVVNRAIAESIPPTHDLNLDLEMANNDELEGRMTAFEDCEDAITDWANNEIVYVSVIFKKCKRIAQLFHQSTNCYDKLKKEMKKQNKKFDGLIQEVPTRWSSSYFMLQRIFQAYDCIVVVLGKIKLEPNSKISSLSYEELQAVPEILECLEMFAEITEEMSGDLYVSSSLIIPTTNVLLEKLNEKIANLKTICGLNFAKTLLKF